MFESDPYNDLLISIHDEEFAMCQADNCDHSGDIVCFLYCYDDDPQEAEELRFYYCAKHAAEEGFCIACGDFFLGCADWDDYGLCANCKNELCDD